MPVTRLLFSSIFPVSLSIVKQLVKKSGCLSKSLRPGVLRLHVVMLEVLAEGFPHDLTLGSLLGSDNGCEFGVEFFGQSK